MGSTTAAWGAGAVMLLLATSVAGIVAAPVAVPAAVYAASRPQHPWLVRVPLLVGAVALALLFSLWLLEGAGTGTYVEELG